MRGQSRTLANQTRRRCCLRLEPENHVPVLISRPALDALLASLSGLEGKLKGCDEDLVLFEPEDPLPLLQGRHRIEAARQFLAPHDKWWVVDLFVDDVLSSSTIDFLRQEYNTSARFCDGDIFRNLRLATLNNGRSERKKWLSRLSATKRRDILQLEKRADKQPATGAFLDALDNLIPYSGLWLALQLGTFHRILSLRCPEVSGIFSGDGRQSS